MNTPKIVSIGIFNAEIAIKNNTVSATRKTAMFEIELPMEAGGVSYINEESCPITDSMIICAKPGQTRHTRLPFKCYYIHMIVNEGSLLDLLNTLPSYIPLSDSEEVREIFLSLIAHYHTELPEDALLLQSLVFRLVYLLKKQSASRGIYKQKASNQAVIERILGYIDAHLSSELTLESLAAEAKFSPIYFHKLFKASTGKTLHEYITELRLQAATVLLTSTDKTLAEIAYSCGFSSQSYFNYAFKKHKGVTPREYAKDATARYSEL